MKDRLIHLLSKIGIGLTSSSNLKHLYDDQNELFQLRNFIEFNKRIDSSFLSDKVRLPSFEEFRLSKSQLNQDLIVLMLLGFPSQGYFVEFGATDGVRFSNTQILEKTFNWQGILAEPGRKWHRELIKNRQAIIDTRCVWRNSGESVVFNETLIGELSTLEEFSFKDMHADTRNLGIKYLVETVSLEDLLDQKHAPPYIEYLSIDTEGSEYEILQNFNFEKYKFGVITCEHNYTDNRELICKLLTGKGYKRVLEEFSLFDDWYVNIALIESQTFI